MDNPPSRSDSNPRYRAIFISPHLDDAVFSCGGEIARLATEGPVLVINIFTRYLSEVKIRGVVLGENRYVEETNAASYLGFESRNLGELDVTFRREAYRKLGNIFRPPVEQDLQWLPELRQKLFDVLSEIEFEQIYVPLGVGWHVDHVLTHLAFEPWATRENLLYYEDAPYCCIPHATRYRLNDIASYPRDLNDASLEPAHALRAWWEAAKAYANTALMKNLQPWIVRKFAVPVVGYYLWRLMARHRRDAPTAAKRKLQPVLIDITDQFERKVEAMTLYKSQFGEFFSSRQDCTATLTNYGKAVNDKNVFVERYFINSTQTQKDIN